MSPDPSLFRLYLAELEQLYTWENSMDSLEILERDKPVEIEITPDMIETGVRAYQFHCSHDEMSFMDPTQLVEDVLFSALCFPKQRQSP